MLSAKAVFPMPGRAARTIRSVFWKPCVSAFSREKPVGRPVSIVPRAWIFWISSSFLSAISERRTKPPRRLPLAMSTSSCCAASRTACASGASTAARVARRDWRIELPAERRLADEPRVALDALDVRDVVEEAGEVGRPSGPLEPAVPLELGLDRDEVDRLLAVREGEARLVDEAVRLGRRSRRGRRAPSRA